MKQTEKDTIQPFKNPHYVTRRIYDEIPLYLQFKMWSMIRDIAKAGHQTDWLQVFHLTAKKGVQVIVHTQEQPDYKKALLVECARPLTAKIYVIDDQTHSTMLYADEY